LDEIQVDDKLNFIEEPVEIMDHEVKRLKKSRILIAKVRWNSRRGPEFTWDREDQMQKKYQHLFTNSAPAAEVATYRDHGPRAQASEAESYSYCQSALELQRGPEFTWEREDQMQKKYPHIFPNSAPMADTTS
nr:putative reverse transcriptase domain-containing protein [Tanacetum cinerariifolium]